VRPRRNNNSSRFGKFLTLQFSASGRMQGAFMKTYLLEKSRITQQLTGEQNYHVLYQVAKGVPADLKSKYGMGGVEAWRYLNLDAKHPAQWDLFPATFEELSAAMDAFPTVAKLKDCAWRILIAILHLGNAQFQGTGEDDAVFVDSKPVAMAASCLGVEEQQLSKAICTLNIKAGLDWIAKPNTTTYSQSVKDALSRALYAKLFDGIVDAINASLMFGGSSRYFIGAVDIFGFECFPVNSLEQLCINFANEKLQRMFTEAVFESILAEYKKEGIDVAQMSYEDNTAVVELIENTPSGILPLLAEECFFPNGSDGSWLQKMKQAHAKNPAFSEDRVNREGFTVHHYPGKVTYDSRGFLMKNKDPLSQDLTVLMQFSDDEIVADLFKEKEDVTGGKKRFKSAKFVGVIDHFRTSLTELVKTLKETKTHFIRCVKPNEVKQPHNFIDNVMMRQLYTSGVVQAVTATRKGFPDHLRFEELLNRFAMVIPKGQAATGGAGCKTLLGLAKVDAAKFRIGKTKVFLGVGVLDMLEQKRMEYIAMRAITMQNVARMYLAKKRLRALREAAERKKREEEEKKKKEEAERLAKEEEERKRREEEEAKLAVEQAKQKEAEEKDRQERFRRARQLSFERKTSKKKREEAEKKKKEAEAAAGEAETAVKEAETAAKPTSERKTSEAAAAEESLVSEEYQRKLEAFQQDVAAGQANDSEMMNVAVVSDIGWKNATGAEPAAEDVWAQYDFKCAVSDVLEYAEYLGMDIKEDAHLLWIADEALQAPEPQGWEQRLDPKGGVYYYHPTTGMSLNQHPLDHHYQQFYLQMKAQYDAMYASEKKEKDEAMAAMSSAPGSSTPAPEEETPRRMSVGEGGEESKKKKSSVFGKMFKDSKKSDSTMTEEMFELAVELTRQQDGLGIGLTLDNIIVEVEPGGSVHAQGDLQYGDQIVSVDGSSLSGRMLKDVIVPKRKHQLVVRYTRMSSQAVAPRRSRARKVQAQGGGAPRRIEELEVTIQREPSGRLGFGIDAMNTVVEVDPQGPVAGKLKVGDKILSVDSQLLNYKRFVDVVGPEATHKLRVARLASANAGGSSQSSKGSRERTFSLSKKKDKDRRASAAKKEAESRSTAAPPPQQEDRGNKMAGMPALREVKLFKDSEETKIGAVFHRSDDAFDKSFFNVEGSSVQPIIKKVDPGSMAESAGLVPGDVVLSVNGISGLSNFQVVEMLRKGQGVFNLVVISGRQVQAALTSQR